MDEQFAFVVMSDNGPSADSTWNEAIRPSIESVGLRAVRVDKEHFTGRVTDEIARRIGDAYFVVAEMSKERPNCYYEVGYAHAMGKPTILLIDDPAKIHFDVKDFNFVVYSSPDECQARLRDRIIGAVLTTRPSEHEGDIQDGKFGRSAIASGRLLSARVSSTNSRYSIFALSVAPLPGAPPIETHVRFYFDASYDPPSYAAKLRAGAAVYEIGADHAFTVGAKISGEDVLLELDLATIPGAHRRFYSAQSG